VKDQACIVGIGETAYVRRPGSGMSLLGLQLQAAVRAIEDAGVDRARIDGLMPFPNLGSAEAFAANLGCENLRYAATVHMGGAAPVASLQAAATAVIAGIASYVLIPAGWNAYSGFRAREFVKDVASIPGGEIARDYYLPHGLTAPPQWYSLMARRHMHEFGTRPEQLGAIAVAMRKHAQLNPRAVMHGRLMSLDDYLASTAASRRTGRRRRW
jgi:acetyl-CoA acetyltransferase